MGFKTGGYGIMLETYDFEASFRFWASCGVALNKLLRKRWFKTGVFGLYRKTLAYIGKTWPGVDYKGMLKTGLAWI